MSKKTKAASLDAAVLQEIKDRHKLQLKALSKAKNHGRLVKAMEKCRNGICVCGSGACWHGEQYVAQLVMAKACQRLGNYERFPVALSLTVQVDTHASTMARDAITLIERVDSVLEQYESGNFGRYLYLEAAGVVVPHIHVFRPGDVRWSLVLHLKTASRTVNDDDWSAFEKSDELAQLGVVDDPSGFAPHMDDPQQFDSILRPNGKFHAVETPLSAEHRATYAGWLHDMSGYQRILRYGFGFGELFPDKGAHLPE